MVKCDNCGSYFKVRESPEYWLLKEKRGNNYRFCSFACLLIWAEKYRMEKRMKLEDPAPVHKTLLEFYDHSASPEDLQSDTSLEVIKE